MWLGQFGDALDQLVPRSDLDTLMLRAAEQTLREAEAAAERHVRETSTTVMTSARTEATALRTELDQRLEGLGTRVGHIEEDATALRLSVGAIAVSAGSKADSAAIEARFKRCEAEISRRVGRPDLEAELAKKLDVRVFLANSSSAAAAAAVSSGGSSIGSGRPLRQASPARGSPRLTAEDGGGSRLVSSLQVYERGVAEKGEGVVGQIAEEEEEEEASFSASMVAAAKLAERVRARKGEAPTSRLQQS